MMHNYTILSGKEVSNHVYKKLQDRVEYLLKNKITVRGIDVKDIVNNLKFNRLDFMDIYPVAE